MKANTAILCLFTLLITWNNKVFSQDDSWTAPKYANDIKNPLKGDVKAVVAGQTIFNQMCIVCHGVGGKGNGVAGVSLTPRPANFLSKSVIGETDGAIFWKLTEGKPPMASYKDLLTEDQRWKLVDYIRQLQSPKH